VEISGGGDLGGLHRLRAVDGAVEFRAEEGDGGGPAEDDEEREGDEGFHVCGASMNLADLLLFVKHLSH
jgi:hypothetical protein